jgi:hypothetical protein
MTISITIGLCADSEGLSNPTSFPRHTKQRTFAPPQRVLGLRPSRSARKQAPLYAFDRHCLMIAFDFVCGDTRTVERGLAAPRSHWRCTQAAALGVTAVHGCSAVEDEVARLKGAFAPDTGKSAGPHIARVFGCNDFVARHRSLGSGEQTANTASNSINERISGIKSQRVYEYERICCC